MVANPINDSLKQAHQGSVSAIIQVLNERLADDGVRTRAMLDGGILQILGEAAHVQDLDQSYVVGKIRDTLEEISPRNMRRVRVNARINQEQQLLWLEEIKKDPENSLLWSEDLYLSRPNLVRFFLQDVKGSMAGSMAGALPGKSGSSLWANATRNPRADKARKKGMLIGGLGTAAVLLALGGGLYYFLNRPSDDAAVSTAVETQVATPGSSKAAASGTGTGAGPTAAMGSPSSAPATAQNPAQPATQNPGAAPAASAVKAAEADPFADAVRLAEAAANAGTQAKTPEAWLAIASQWSQAADLMAKVPPSDTRYVTAQDRTRSYRENATLTLKQAR
jgi:F0F1-type ATP synthase membrane subunit c/vacuolar-type H+-ATPase subunit K